MLIGRAPLHYVFVDANLIPITRNTAIISKKVKQISKELKVEQARAKSLSAYADRFDLGEFVEVSNNDTDYLSTWMKEAKKIQLDQADKEEIEKQGKKHEEDDIVILEEEKDMLKVYYTYGWETKTVNPLRFDPIDILKYLSDFDGLHYEAKDDFGRTPLHYAACVGAFSCSTLLIDKKVDVNAVDSDNVSTENAERYIFNLTSLKMYYRMELYNWLFVITMSITLLCFVTLVQP